MPYVRTRKIAQPQNSKAYLVGSGIASLSAAVYMIRDGKMPGKNITIFEYENFFGGSLDAVGNPENGYLCRGTRGFEFNAYVCMQDLFNSIPSLRVQGKTLDEEIKDFCSGFTINTKTRLMKNGDKVSAVPYGISKKDFAAMNKLILSPENKVRHRPVTDFFSEEFFQTNFWWMFSTLFAFAPWHSAGEVRRYMLAFFQNVPDLHTFSSIRACPVNNEENIVQPIVSYLQKQGVHFEKQTEVIDVNFIEEGDNLRVQSLVCRKDAAEYQVDVKNEDHVFITLGSIACKTDSGSWKLWHKISKKGSDFGNPDMFTSQPGKSTMITCTLTFNDMEIWNMLEKLFDNVPDTNRITTFMDSPWSMSLICPKQPWFSNQPKDTRVLWCYGIWPEGKGKFIPKTMVEATPEEILTELYSLLKLNDIPRLINKTIIRKEVLPTGHAQFLCRKEGDRPEIIPNKSTNFAFLGQYVECEGTTYTMEYSIRGAQKAVYHLFDIKKPIPKIYKGVLHPRNVVRAAKVLL